MRIRDPKPEIQRLEELVKEIRYGEIRLPKFQRPFVWNKADMLNLMDSIYNGYPIGSILLWNSSERLKSERKIFDFDVNHQASDTYPTDYLLDGQQRLTTLCGALFWSGTDTRSIWNIYFDLESEKFVHSLINESIRLFPLNKLLATSDFIRQCMKFEHHPQARLYYSNAEKLLESIKNYKIAVVKIGDIPLDEIAPIFERINSTGRKLTMVDLMRAATWKGQFDLSETIEEITQTAVELGFGEIPDTSILRSLSASAGYGINKADIDRLRTLSADELNDVASQAKTALQSAMIFLRDEIGMPDSSYLPYGVQLTHLAEFFRICPEPNRKIIDRLRNWFWITSVTRYFAGANTGQNSKDLLLIRDFAFGAVDDIFGLDFVVDLNSLMFDEFNLRTASSITFALLQIHARPENLLIGYIRSDVDFPELSRDLFLDVLPSSDIYRNSNVAQVYFPKKLRKKRFDTARSLPSYELFIDGEAIECLVEGDSAGFVHARVKLVREKLVQLTGRDVTFVGG